MKYLFLLSLMFMIFGCKNSNDNNPLILFENIEKVHFLGHKGSGTKGELDNKDINENSINAVQRGFDLLDGVEIDIQISSDSSLWLFHDHFIIGCDDEKHNFSSLKNEQIKEISQCNYDLSLIELKELTHFFSNHNNKFLSLDLKVLQNPLAIQRFGGREELAKLIVEKLNEINIKKIFNVLVEIPFKDQLTVFESQGYKTFLLHHSSNNTDSLDIKNINGLSLDINDIMNDESSQQLVKKVEKKQIWTINDGTDLFMALKHNPDFIQTDYLQLIGLAKKAENKFTLIESKNKAALKEEFSPIFKSTLEESKSFFIAVNFISKTDFSKDDLAIVVSVNDESGQSLFWKDIAIKQGENTIIELASTLTWGQGSSWSLYFWNKSKQKFLVENFIVKCFNVLE